MTYRLSIVRCREEGEVQVFSVCTRVQVPTLADYQVVIFLLEFEVGRASPQEVGLVEHGTARVLENRRLEVGNDTWKRERNLKMIVTLKLYIHYIHHS